MIDSPPDAITISYLTGAHHRWIGQVGEFAECDDLAAFKRLIDSKGVIGFVVCQGSLLVGYGAYEFRGNVKIHEGQVILRELVIVPRLRRCGFGRLALRAIAQTWLGDTRPYLIVTVCETNLAAQQWLRACGVPAVKLIRGYFAGRDAIKFRHTWGS